MPEHEANSMAEQEYEFDVAELREDYAEWSNLGLALHVVLLISAAASGIEIVVDGQAVARQDLIELVPYDGEDGDELEVRIPANQAELTPSLVALDVPDRFALERTEQGVCFEPLLEFLEPRVPKILSMATDLFDLRAKLLRKYPRPFHEEPSLLFF